MTVDLQTAIKRLKEKDNIVILLHQFPDGDTIGCGYSLYFALTALGKKARVECADGIGARYSYIIEGVEFEKFTPEFVVAVDVADRRLLGAKAEEYPHIDLCIDHHASNSLFADETYVDAESAAACEILYSIVKELCGSISKPAAAALYTGISTDTGCFKFTNTTAKTHIIAAELMKTGIDYGEINRIMFDTKSKARLLVEKEALNTIKFLCDDKVAIMTVTKEMREKSGAHDSELEGITGLPRTIEGVLLGITIRERNDTSVCKISARSHEPISASDFCERFGGGGHARAAGCEIKLPKEKAFEALAKAAEETLKNAELV